MTQIFIAGIFVALTLSTVQAKAAFTDADAIAEAAKYDTGCFESTPRTVTKIENKFRDDENDVSSPERTAEFYFVTCVAGAYAEKNVLLRVETRYTNTGATEVLAAVPLASPRMNKYGNVSGMTAEVVVDRLSFDVDKNVFVTFAKAQSGPMLYLVGTYALYRDEVILRRYVVDRKEGRGGEKVVFKTKASLTR